ncbi:hypothetical protein Pla123a_47940 [Posidoniimonas polymericola]|uniref:Uncharacterized protein n=1 Tax=Posidoniimonas polymericola TaxID=2528002 RepID=A0A5C5XTL6_9BACT|nr:hypothetical protein [Posidoniimonas polymericola]TWT66270.1 hypothetical protein Pla123a_47940 [Posidoniimonas polymericola]
MTPENPFEYVGANDLEPRTILDYYIEDFNFSRFVSSSRNVFLVGERGCGKSMTLRYSSYPVQSLRAASNGVDSSLGFVGVYVPCNTPLNHKREQQLLDPARAAAISEHYLVISLAYHLADTLRCVSPASLADERGRFREEFEYLLNDEVPADDNVFVGLMRLLDRQNLKAQRAVNSREIDDAFFDETYSFSTLIVPLLGLLRTSPTFKSSHFGFMIDDAQDLDEQQRRSLFSWVAYRDHSLFSMKIAITSLADVSLATAGGGTILEGHDYTTINMVQPFQNPGADFGKMASRLVSKRLEIAGIKSDPYSFFPISREMTERLKASEDAVREDAVQRFGNEPKKVGDYVYKYARPHFFRTRPSKANRPEYSGFDTLVFLSTGVVRNLLLPCYWMFDKAVSARNEGGATEVSEIPPSVQSAVIIERSEQLWQMAEHELDKMFEDCSSDNAKRAFQLLDALAVLFRKRLLSDISEPAANSFAISGRKNFDCTNLDAILQILIASQLLYTRLGNAKEKGRRQTYYVPNRLLWPARGLDPHGQHARVSLKAADLWASADRGADLPFSEGDGASPQMELFGE